LFAQSVAVFIDCRSVQAHKALGASNTALRISAQMPNGKAMFRTEEFTT